MKSDLTIHSKNKKFRPNEISTGWSIGLNIFFTIMAIITVLPVALVIIISFSSMDSINKNGYRFIPMEWTIEAYTNLLKTGSSIADSYLITIFYTFVGTALSLFVMSMYAYVLAQKEFKLKSVLAFYTFFTTLFSGGLVPSYILNVRYLHLDNTIWIFILPSLVQAFNVIILRTFVQSSIPDSLFDSAKIDGANDWGVYIRIVLPLFKAGLATIGLFNVVSRWNDWFTGMLYIENPKLVPIMTYLQKIQKDIEFLKRNSDLDGSPDAMEMLRNIPTESTRMAITVIATLPLLVMYPFFQKYFIKGMTIGSVKG